MSYSASSYSSLQVSLRKSVLVMLPLFLVLFIDSMSLGLLFPILNSIIVDPIVNFLPSSYTVGTRDLLYGTLVSCFMICWFFGAAILGDVSDSIGRKKAMLVCLFGTCLGYFLTASAIMLHSLTLLFFSRMLAGFTAGSQPIAQAAIVDISNDINKPRNISFIFIAIAFGFILGPILGGTLSDTYLVNWFTFATPLYFATLLTFVNMLLLWAFFPETYFNQSRVKIKFAKALQVFIAAFTQKRLRNLSAVLLIEVFGWSNYYTFIALFLFERYHMTALHVAFFLSVLAAGFIFACGILVDLLAKRYSLKYTIAVALSLTASAVLLTLLTHQQIFAWIAAFIIGASGALAYSDLIVMFSNQVEEHEQGWVMGVTGSIMALCFGITALITGIVAEIGPEVPMVLSFVGLGLSAVMMFLL